MSGPVLVVVAHPDDESFLFGGRMLDHPGREHDVVVVTDGRASDGPELRRARLEAAANLFGFRVRSFGSQPDSDGRLDVHAVVELLQGIDDRRYEEVWTHGPLGDYQAHPHHQDVALACALVFGRRARLCTSGLLEGGDGYRLGRRCYEEKITRLHRCYPAETEALETDFLMFTNEELISVADLEEVVQIYAWLVGPSAAEIVRADRRVLDVWRRRDSPHEAEVLAGCAHALGSRAVEIERALVIGDSLGLFCEALLGVGIARRVDALEPFTKHHEEIARRGATPLCHADAEGNYDGVLLFEMSCSPLAPSVPGLLAAHRPETLISVDFLANPPALTFGHSVEECLFVPGRCECGRATSFGFRYPDTRCYLLRRTP